MNSIIGYHTTRFGELWDKSLVDLIRDALFGVLDDTHLEKKQIDAIFFGNMLGGILENQLLFSGYISEIMGTRIPVYRVEAACASGGMAFQMANEYLKAQKNKTVLVLGAEKMTDVSTGAIADSLGAAASFEEKQAGLTFPGVYALIAQMYFQTYGYDEKHLAAISVKNHAHGVLNDKAHFQRAVSLDAVLSSPYVAYPLKVLDSSPISDGSAALVLSNDTSLIKSHPAASILSSEIATDSIAIANRADILTLEATKSAAEKAFTNAHIKRKDIRIMEVHDCFSIAEILALEDLGFWEKGKGGANALEMETHRESGSTLIVNTSGGLKAAGHPVAGTGIKQIGEIYMQITGRAGVRQIKNVSHGLAHNVGGSGGVAVVSILGG